MGVVSALAHHSHNMKFLVLSACVLVASARPSYGGHGHAASFHGLVGHPNGAVVPVDEPAVAAARAAHLTALGATHGAHAAYGHDAPIAAVHAAPIAHHGYAGPLNLNTHLVAHPNGAVVPLTNLPSLPPVPTTSPPRELPTLLLVPLLLPPLSLLLDLSLLDPSLLVESMPMLPQLPTAMVVPST